MQQPGTSRAEAIPSLLTTTPGNQARRVNQPFDFASARALASKLLRPSEGRVAVMKEATLSGRIFLSTLPAERNERRLAFGLYEILHLLGSGIGQRDHAEQVTGC